MPKVPNDGPEPQPAAPPQAPPTFMLMAAAIMHQQGRLFKPEEKPNGDSPA